MTKKVPTIIMAGTGIKKWENCLRKLCCKNQKVNKKICGSAISGMFQTTKCLVHCILHPIACWSWS